MEPQACEVIIGVGIAAAVIGVYALIRHLRNAGRSADADLKQYVGKHYEEKADERDDSAN